MVKKSETFVKIDGHVHTMVGTRPLARDSIVSLPRLAAFIQWAIDRRCSIVISDHDRLDSFTSVRTAIERMSINTVRDLGRLIEIVPDVYVIAGEEVSTREGHILAWGVAEKVHNRLSLKGTLGRIRDQGGIAIAAHPFQPYGISEKKCRENYGGMYGLELSANNGSRKQHQIRKVAEDLGLQPVGGSDAHDPMAVGRAYSVYPAELFRKDTDQDILDALRHTAPHETRVEPFNISEWVATRLDKHLYEMLLALRIAKRS